MCGICGIVRNDGNPVSEELLEKMCRAFSYRGPDDSGTHIYNSSQENGKAMSVGLGHQRLSIIDLSELAHQPMLNEDGSICLTYNGEIYNFKSLRMELEEKGHFFKSQSDTEVILHLYEETGTDAVKKLNGMFSFGLWDDNTKSLWLCRDRIGIKPLVYYWDGRHFAFASEIKSLLCDPRIRKELDYDSLQLYLTFSYIPAPWTIFKNIRKLEPGHSLVIADGRISVWKYWDLPKSGAPSQYKFDLKTDFEGYCASLRQTLSDAVKARMVADVPLGAFLSGGIDSSVIVALMAMQSSEPIKTFSIGFKDDPFYDETRFAEKVARKYQTDHREFKLTYRDMIEVLPGVLETFDEPFSDSSAIPTYIVSRETRQHVTVALSGDGGDELFGGYRSYLGEYFYAYYSRVPSLLRENLFEKIILSLPDSREKRWLEYVRRIKKFIKGSKGDFIQRSLALKEIFPPDFRKKLLGTENNDGQDVAMGRTRQLLDGYDFDRINSLLYTDLKDSLPGDMLTKVDWMSMKNSLEVRVPFLDHRVVELAFRLDGFAKLRWGKTKYVLKKTFKDLLPKSVLRRSKAGFEIPISRWLRNDLSHLIDRYLARDRIEDQQLFDYATVEFLVRSLMQRRTDTSWMLWNLIVFQYWHEKYL